MIFLCFIFLLLLQLVPLGFLEAQHSGVSQLDSVKLVEEELNNNVSNPDLEQEPLIVRQLSDYSSGYRVQALRTLRDDPEMVIKYQQNMFLQSICYMFLF